MTEQEHAIVDTIGDFQKRLNMYSIRSRINNYVGSKNSRLANKDKELTVGAGRNTKPIRHGMSASLLPKCGQL